VVDLYDGGETTSCTRFRRDGTRCTNTTTHADGWCRQSGCGGFLRARTAIAPPSAGRVRRSPRVRATLSPTDLPDSSRIRVSVRALDSFRFHHGGSEATADQLLRAMLDDFRERSTATMDGAYVLLSRRGYRLILAKDLSTITGYWTIHRERTWAQYTAGVPSRFGQQADRDASGPTPVRAAALPAEAIAAAVDPSNVHLTARARSNFAALRSMRSVPDDALDRAMRAEIRTLVSGALDPSYTGLGVVRLVVGDLRWLVRTDALMIVGVSGPPEP
jgi:hypothetical protein